MTLLQIVPIENYNELKALLEDREKERDQANVAKLVWAERMLTYLN